MSAKTPLNSRSASPDTMKSVASTPRVRVNVLDVKTELEHFHEDWLFFEAHYYEFLERYPEHWVAVLDKRVVGTDPDFEHLLRSLKSRGVPLSKITVEKVTSKQETWILAAQF